MLPFVNVLFISIHLFYWKLLRIFDLYHTIFHIFSSDSVQTLSKLSKYLHNKLYRPPYKRRMSFPLEITIIFAIRNNNNFRRKIKQIHLFTNITLSCIVYQTSKCTNFCTNSYSFLTVWLVGHLNRNILFVLSSSYFQ